jgi:hypothetical protein
MAQIPVEKMPKLPFWFVKLCSWFWEKQTRMWWLIGGKIFTVMVWLIGLLLVTSGETLKTWPLKGVIDGIARNGIIYTLILLLLLIILLFLTIISYIVSHIQILLQPQAFLQEDQQKKEYKKQEEQEYDLKRVYLRYLQREVELLPPLGLGVSDLISPQGVLLADVFIPLEFRESPKALKLQPLDQDEIQEPSLGLDQRHADYLLIDPKGEWERSFMQRDHLGISDLWELLSPERPAAVIQGSPGMGKSTLLSRMTLSMACQGLEEPDPQLVLTPTLIPILVLIREYADYLNNLPAAPSGREQENQRSLFAFIAHNIQYKLSRRGCEAKQDMASELRHWLRERCCLVMFDGLDEVSDKALQKEIQQAIRDFIEQQRHPDVQTPTYNRFLITSRIAEYDAPALEGYRYFLVAELSYEQISNFLPRWYGASAIASVTDVKARTERLTAELISAIDKNNAVQKLAENPLLLTLMAIMLYNGTSLPERRIELYQAVTKTLLESRNEIKGLPKLYEDEAIQRLGPLAFTMQLKGNSLARRGDVEAAVRRAIESPLGSGARSAEQIETDVKDYVESIGRRGGLFVLRTGDYYGFVHRSFQEYFAACHMLREIECDREKIKDFVKLVRENPNTWREPFILAVALKSSGDGGAVASAMIQALLRSRGANALRDLLLAVTCVTEAKYVNLQTALQRDIAERLLSHYEQAQKEQRFDDCAWVEGTVKDWLLVLREKESYLELPHMLQQAICDTQHPERQCSALMLFTMIAKQLISARYNIHALLIPVLLALTGLESIGEYQPAARLPIATNFDVADLALTALSFMGRRGPAGLLLKELRQYFKDNPQQLRDLARYSLESSTLITPTVIPDSSENYNQYEAAIGEWIQLRDRYKKSRITDKDIASCLAIHQTLLDCAEEAKYPTALHLRNMLQQAVIHPKQWQQIWQDYLLEQMNTGCYISYQRSALFWAMLFPDKQDIQSLANHIVAPYSDTHITRQRYSQRFTSTLSIGLIDLRYLLYLRNLRDLRTLRDVRYLRYLRDLLNLLDLRELKDLEDLGYLRELRNLICLMDWRYLINLTYLRYLSELTYLRYLEYLRYLRELVLTYDIAKKACVDFPSIDRLQKVDLLMILMGRMLQVQETDEMGQGIEEEVQRLAIIALDYLKQGGGDIEVIEAALDVIHSLPARTAGEIQFVWQVVDGTTDSRIHVACARALLSAKPKDGRAWKELEKGKTSSVKEVRDAVEEIYKKSS